MKKDFQSVTQTSPSKLNSYDYQFLTGKWQGVKGAAYNQTYEFCKEVGWCRQDGSLTEAGLQAVKDYEDVTYALSIKDYEDVTYALSI